MQDNLIVMTDAGKPVYSKTGTEEDVARQCALFQAIRTAVNDNDGHLDLGEIQSIHSNDLVISFMVVGAISLVSITRQDEMLETPTFARLQLEHVYGQLIFSLTDQAQTVIAQNPGFDLRSMMTGAENSLIDGILEEFESQNGNPGPFLTASVQTVFPISRKLRDKASRSLYYLDVPNTAFALLLVGDKLLSYVQSSFRAHQLRVSDMQLIINFIRKHQSLSSSELWVPMCLPRFNSSGFLYAYIKLLDATSKLTLVLLSTHNTTEQFQLYRNVSGRVQQELGLPPDHDSVLQIVTSSHDSSSVMDPRQTFATQDVAWRRSDCSFDDSTEDGYVNIAHGAPTRHSLLEEVRQSCELSSFEKIAQKYFEKGEEPLLHFLFRVDVPVKSVCSSSKASSSSQGGKSILTQCISPAASPSFSSAKSRHRLYTLYQKLGLRLRLGSATVESTMDAFDMITQAKESDDNFPNIVASCPAIGLMESPPNVHGVTYIVEGDEIFLAMNGRDFELYMVTSKSIPIKQAAGIGTKLVRRLQADEKDLFLMNPRTWKV
eukprot:scaffold812_cov124-Cylindrotheca_fusiformis.AAC.6